VTESETETVIESETVTGFTWSRCSSRTPDTGPRTPDSGPDDPFSGDYPMDQGPPIEA